MVRRMRAQETLNSYLRLHVGKPYVKVYLIGGDAHYRPVTFAS